MDQKKPLEQFEDSDFVPSLTLTFKDKAEADAIAATFNAARKSQGLLARTRVSEVKAPEPN